MTKAVKIQNKESYLLKISLNHIKPLIWRKIIVDSKIKLSDLHKVIQTVMGWTNSHLHHFMKDGKFYSEPDEDAYDEFIDYRKIKLNQILLKEKQSLTYEYDFGDSWEHKIVLEKIIGDIIEKYPICLDGKGNCPPEDCGGSTGYENLLEIIKDPKNEEYNEMMEWLGGEFDPDYFDIEEVNELLKEKNYGCLTIF